MRRTKVIATLLLSILILLSFNNFVNAETTKGEETLELEEQVKPSVEFKKQISGNTRKVKAKAAQEQIYTSGNYKYKIEKDYRITATNVSNIIISDHTEDIAIITEYTGNESTVTIPTKLGGKRVYKIEEAAFYKNTSIKKLVIPDNTVGYIGNGAFADCTNLAEVSLGNSANNISYYAFQNTALTSIKLPASLEAIRSTTFFNCNKLENITIDSKNVHFKVIDSVIYELNSSGDMEIILYPYAKKDTTYTVPNNVKVIGREAIINNYVQTINISSSVNSIGDFAFTTSNLKNINVNSANTTFSSINGVLFSKDKKTIYLYPAGRTENTYNIPNGTTIIETRAFYNTQNLKHVNIPNTVIELKLNAFGYAKGLEDITIPSSVKEIGAQIFSDCPNLKKAIVSANTEVLSYLMFKECDNLEEVIVNGNIKTIIKGAFYYCPKLTKVTLPDSLERINYGAFWVCRGLKNITIPRNVVLLEECAFYEYTNISKDYWADTKFDISKTQLKKQSDGNYMAVYDYTVKGMRDYEKAYAVLDLVNQERRKAGLSELMMDKDLLENAMKRASETVTYFEHERPNGLDCFSAITRSYGAAAENIAEYQTTASSVMNSWMNSAGHRQNILTSRYTCIGIGCYKADDGRYYWTQLFTNGTPTAVTKPQNVNKEETIKILMNRIPFKDVKSTDWYFGAVKYSVVNQMISGYNSTTFAPNDKLTRGMLVTILHRMEGTPKSSINNKFNDVKESDYYYSAVKWATEKGIVHGYNANQFGPNDTITRQDLVVILRNYAIQKKKNTNGTADLTKFKDGNSVTSYAKSAMQWAVEKGVITGNPGTNTLNPLATTSRAEAASMLFKYCATIGR